MARLNCYECHKPHTRIRSVDGDCLRCHSPEMLEKKSTPAHRAGKRCIGCHHPHRWKAK